MKKTIVFVVDVQHTHDLAALFKGASIPTEVIIGNTPRTEQWQIIESFGKGQAAGAN